MEKMAFRIFIFLLIFSPLAFGSTELWSITIMESLSFLATILFLANKLRQKTTLVKTPGLLPLSLFLGYLLIQIIPLPPPLVSLLAPETFNIYLETIANVDPTAWFSISINQKATLFEFYRYASYVCIYFLAVQLLIFKEKLETTVNVFITFGTLVAVFGMIQYYTSKDTIYWLREVPLNSIIFGPYVNHNHFAGLMEMILPLALALFLCLKPKIRYKTSFREKIVQFFDLQELNSYILYGFSACLLALAIILSLSRGAMISTCLSLLIFTIFLIIKGNSKNKGFLFILFLIVVIFSVNWFGWDRIFERFERMQSDRGEIYDARLDFWKDSATIINKHPLTGIGFGNFGAIYPRYRSFNPESEVSVLHAHNDYLELLTEGGVIAGGLVVWFLGVLFYKTFKIYRKRRERYSIYLFLGCFTGILSILLHSVTDFNLHIGANGFYYFVLCCLLVSAGNTRLRSSSQQTILKPVTSRHLSSSLGIIVFLILITGTTFNMGGLIGKLHFSAVENLHFSAKIPKDKLQTIENIVDKALAYDPLEGKYHYAKANVHALINGFPSALKNYQMAIKRNPFKADYLQRMGLILSSFHLEKYGEMLLKSGIKADITNPEMYRQYASWALSYQHKNQGILNLKKALSLEPKRIRQYITLMLINDFSEKEILETLPKRVRPYFGYGDYLVKNGNHQQAEQAYLTALSYVKNEKKIYGWFFGKVYNYYYRAKRYSNALEIVTQAVDHLPKNVQIRIWMARAYQKLGINYRAVEEYKVALTIDPKSRQAIKGLNQLQSSN